MFGEHTIFRSSNKLEIISIDLSDIQLHSSVSALIIYLCIHIFEILNRSQTCLPASLFYSILLGVFFASLFRVWSRF